MKIRSLAALLFLHTTCSVAQQEDTAQFEGRWAVVLQLPSGAQRRAVLVLSGFGGQWKEAPSPAGRQASCQAKKSFPVTVQKSVTTELEFSVWPAMAAPGCKNLHITVEPKSARALAGTSPDGHVVTMTRL